MAFTSQSTSSIADFFSKLNTFLSGEGWSTHHNASLGEFAAWKNPSGSTWITMATNYDTTTSDAVGIYQWHGAAYSSGSNPWAQTNDSGNGAASDTNATLAGQRHVKLADQAAVSQFWCFEDTNYFHVVARTGNLGTYRYWHFGSGLLTKFNDWTGGEYCYGQAVEVITNGGGVARLAPASYLLDGLAADGTGGQFQNMEERCATLHIEGMNNQGGSSKWGVVLGNQNSANLGVDRAAVARIHINGGFRGGVFPVNMGNFTASFGRGLVPLYPIHCFYWNRTTDHAEGPLGYMPDVRGVHLLNFEDGDSITVGSDTWVVFPSARKLESVSSNLGTSGYQGIAYKQVA